MSAHHAPNPKVVAPVLLGLGLIAGLSWSGVRALHPAPPQAAGIPVTGNVEVTSVELAFKLPGRLAERQVDEGQCVQAQDVVARLEVTDADHQLAQAAAALKVAQANETRTQAAYEAIQAGSRPQDVAVAAAALREAQTTGEQIGRDYERVSRLFDGGAIPRREYENARTMRDAATQRVTQARERFELIQIGPRPQDIAQAKAAWMQAQAAVDQAQAAVATARTQRGYTELRSPIGGVITAKNAEPGEVVAPGTPIVTVADLAHTWVRAYVSEQDLGKVHLGQQAEIRTDSYPDKRYQGQVSFIAPEAEFTPKNVQTQQDRVKLVYRIKIDVPNPHDELKPGMPVDALLQEATGSVVQP